MLDDQKILEKIAYWYYEYFKREGRADDRDRDWRYAVRALIHLKEPINYRNYTWRSNEDDFGMLRPILTEAKNNEREVLC